MPLPGVHMPYASVAQQAYLHANHPEVARKFDRDTTKAQYAQLPKRKRKKTK